jgi:hypothetical protein
MISPERRDKSAYFAGSDSTPTALAGCSRRPMPYGIPFGDKLLRDRLMANPAKSAGQVGGLPAPLSPLVQVRPPRPVPNLQWRVFLQVKIWLWICLYGIPSGNKLLREGGKRELPYKCLAQTFAKLRVSHPWNNPFACTAGDMCRLRSARNAGQAAPLPAVAWVRLPASTRVPYLISISSSSFLSPLATNPLSPNYLLFAHFSLKTSPFAN